MAVQNRFHCSSTHIILLVNDPMSITYTRQRSNRKQNTPWGVPNITIIQKLAVLFLYMKLRKEIVLTRFSKLPGVDLNQSFCWALTAFSISNWSD